MVPALRSKDLRVRRSNHRAPAHEEHSDHCQLSNRLKTSANQKRERNTGNHARDSGVPTHSARNARQTCDVGVLCSGASPDPEWDP